MFAPATRIVLTSLVFSTSFAAPMLSLHVSGPEIVEGIENLKLVVTVTNVGDETLDLLKDPRSPLSNSLPTDKFGIINRAGVMPSFNGIVTKYNPSEAALVQSEGAFIILAPGDFVDIEHNLWKAYNFTLSGPGHYSFEPRNLFYYVNSTSTAVPIYARTIIHEAHISGRLAVTRENPAPTAREYVQFVGCTVPQQLRLQDAFAQADYMVKEASTYLQTLKDKDRFTTWFGAYSWFRYYTVASHFKKISSAYFASYTYDCTCKNPAAQAFVNISLDHQHLPPILG